MICAPEEAKNKWCPMARIDSEDKEGSFNRYKDGDPAGRCIADDCMLWVWNLDNYSNTHGSCGLSSREA
jgi:hypothetical protein